MTPQIPPTLFSSNSILFPECFPRLDSQLIGYCFVQEPQTFSAAVETCGDLEMQLLHLKTQTEQLSATDALTQLFHEPWDVTVWANGDKVENHLK